MDTQGSSTSQPSDGTITDKASQGGHRPTEVKPALEVNNEFRSLLKDAVNGDWKAVETVLNSNPRAITTVLLKVDQDSYTVLDIADMAGQDQLAENLVRYLPSNEPSTLRRSLFHAAWSGRLRRVKELTDGGPTDEDVKSALTIATAYAPRQKELIQYLAMRINSIPDVCIITNLIRAGHLDILLYLACRFEDVATSLDNEGDYTLLKAFASRAELNFREKCIYQCIPRLVNTSSTITNNIRTTQGISLSVNTSSTIAEDIMTTRGRIAYLILHAAPFIKRIGELKLRHECWLELAKLVFRLKEESMTAEMHELAAAERRELTTAKMRELNSAILLDAASKGISEIVKLCLKHYPELMWDKGLTLKLMEEVVRARHVELFRLINGYNTVPKLTYDSQRDCVLMASLVEWSPKYVPADVSGSAFLMQRELQWFKVLEDRCSPLIKSMRFKVKMKEDESDPSHKSLELELVKDGRGKTYWNIFVEQRKDLLKEAGQWMKDTSSSCSLVATLIITIAFAAAFTVPGNNDDSTGIPIFLKKGSFMVFAVADALALFSSVTATLMFLAILTSRYAAEDFLHSLPRKMVLGLTFLFLSLAFMLMAFGAALTIILSKRCKWIYIPITLLAAFPIILFVILQLRLYVEMVESTYRPRLYRPMKIWK